MGSLNCRKCGATIQADQVDRRLAIAVCSHCGTVLDLTKRRAASNWKSFSSQDGFIAPRAIAPLPEGVLVEKDKSRTKITLPWSRIKGLLLLILSVILFSLIYLFYTTTDARFSEGVTKASIIAFIIASYVAYVTFVNLFNKTIIVLNSEWLRIRHRPLPWFGNVTLDTQDIEQFYVVEENHRAKDGGIYSYTLNAVTRDHRKILILKGLATPDQGLFLEHALEEVLDIRDRAVAGEVAYGQRFRA